MNVSRHLRDFHGYNLAESVARAPRLMARQHEAEHEDGHVDHDVNDLKVKPERSY